MGKAQYNCPPCKKEYRPLAFKIENKFFIFLQNKLSLQEVQL